MPNRLGGVAGNTRLVYVAERHGALADSAVRQIVRHHVVCTLVRVPPNFTLVRVGIQLLKGKATPEREAV